MTIGTQAPHPQSLDSSVSKDAAGAVTRVYSSLSHIHYLYKYQLLLIAFIASVYGLYYQLYGFYHQHSSRHSSKHQQSRCFDSSSHTSIPAPPSPEAMGEDYTNSVFLPYVYKFRTESVPLVKVTVHAGAEGVAIDMPVDTGSTGVLIGAPLLPGVDPHVGTKGRQYLSSSHIVYVGRYLDLDLTFHGGEGVSAETRVPVLVVEKSWVCPWYDPSKHGYECPRGPGGEVPLERDVSEITYMGVGFGRNKNAEGQRTASSEGNPFLNIRKINGTTVSKRDVKGGYVVSTKGIQIGLTRENTRGFNFMRLENGAFHEEDPRDWAMPRVQFYVNGHKSIPGFALIDTGISQMYIRGEDSMHIPEVIVKNPKVGGKPVHRVKNGTQIAIKFGAVAESNMGEIKAEYSFVVGEHFSLMAPTYAVPGRQEPPPYVNTGRNFLKGYSIAFDAIEGRLGFRAVETWKSMI